MTSTFSSVTPALSRAPFNMSRSPPGSTSAAFMVLVHQISEQFCCSGVTGRMATRIGGSLASVMAGEMALGSDNCNRQSIARKSGKRFSAKAMHHRDKERVARLSLRCPALAG